MELNFVEGYNQNTWDYYFYFLYSYTIDNIVNQNVQIMSLTILMFQHNSSSFCLDVWQNFCRQKCPDMFVFEQIVHKIIKVS